MKRTRILVIDDRDDEFPYEILRKQGYAIDYWSDVEDMGKLENGFYDIIVLDVVGVGRKYDEKNEGAGILKHIKISNPSQIVVAYSGQAHESQRIPFFTHADQYVSKPTNAIVWKETIDDLMRSKMTAEHYWNAVREMLTLAGVDSGRINRLESNLAAAIAKGKKADPSELVFKSLGTLDKGLTTISVIAKIITLFAR